jgi:hypothetical protein
MYLFMNKLHFSCQKNIIIKLRNQAIKILKLLEFWLVSKFNLNKSLTNVF